MNKVTKRIGLVTLATLWAVGIWYGIRTVPVGLAFQPGQKGQVAVVSVDSDGHESESPLKNLDSNGVATFGVGRGAKTFYFRLYNEGSEEGKEWQLDGIRILGMPAIRAVMVTRFEMRKKLYDAPPMRDGEPLVLTVDDGDAIDLPNVFPYVLHVLVAMQGIVAALPLLLLVLFAVFAFLKRRFGNVVWTFVNREGEFSSIVVAAMALTLPVPVTPVSPGLDPSWIWLMNRFAGEPIFGGDFVFTYGPLGFLIAPQCFGTNVAVGMVVNMLFSFLFGGMVILIHRYRQVDSGRIASFLLLALWLLVWPNGMEWKWCLTSVTACALAVLVRELDDRSRMSLLVLAAVTAVLQSFVKFSSCITVIGQHLFLLAYGWWRERRRMVLGIGVYSLVAVVSIVLMAFFLFPSSSSFFAWTRGSVEIASGYNLVMGGDKPWPELASTVALLILFLMFLLVGKVGRYRAVIYWLIFSPFLFCTYKYAIVRQSGIPLMLGIAWLSAVSMIVDTERARRSVKMVLLFTCAALLLGIVWSNTMPHLCISPGNLIANVCPARTMHQAAADAEKPVATARLPAVWLERIGTNRVMIAGWEMGPAMSDDLNLVPFPATQTYSAYTPYLDERCAERVAREGEDAVRFILAPANPWSFDSRNIYFDNPRLWRAVRRHFRCVAQNTDHVLLQRRSAPLPLKEMECAFALKRPLLDKLRALLFRPVRAMAHFTYADGKQYACFANLEVLNGTPVPQGIPTTPEEVPSYLGDSSHHLSLVTKIEVIQGGDVLFLYERRPQDN